MLVYSISLKNGLPDGTDITNRAGIYFDYNPVVLTNTAYNRTGCPTSVHNAVKAGDIRIYPNPTGNEFMIITNNTTYNSCILTDMLGHTVLEQKLQPQRTTVDIRNLPAGVYYISLIGNNGNVVRKIVKM
ncbi:MAG: hypothetical protein BGO69_04025 [Bacteroidetes bacterium 46-16]|nr:MAG: hypothetical protein BGO69_04025 [Bacteroidetes bacterium 46-16]